MTPIAQYIVKQDALALAEYFAAKPWPSTGAPSAAKADQDAAMVAINSVVCTAAICSSFKAIRPFRGSQARNAIISPRR